MKLPHRLKEEWIQAAGLSGCSQQLAEAVMAAHLAQQDPSKNVLITGNFGNAYSLALYMNHLCPEPEKAPRIPCYRYGDDIELFVSELFGAETCTVEKGYPPRTGLLEPQNLPRTIGSQFIWMDGTEVLGERCLNFLTEVIARRCYRRYGGREVFPLHQKWVLTDYIGHQPSRAENNWLWFFKRVRPEWIDVPMLHERPEDVAWIAHTTCAEASKKMSFARELSPRTIQKLLEYPWVGGEDELQGVVLKAVVTSVPSRQVEPWEMKTLPPYTLKSLGYGE